MLDAIEQINQLDASREEERISLVTQAQQSLQPLSCALWDAFTGGDSAAAKASQRPGAPPMEDDPLWHQMQYGLALEQALDLHAPS